MTNYVFAGVFRRVADGLDRIVDIVTRRVSEERLRFYVISSLTRRVMIGRCCILRNVTINASPTVDMITAFKCGHCRKGENA